ncbi:RAxF-45 family protein [Cytobacillus sp. IB215665]|nr:RAxF-45 family protein [Cytobacillus sp. IB215665]MDX8364584.1 RAxF-45 family protein [Cytobacillus sp. IB215665]
MLHSVINRNGFLSYIYICRAIFHGVVFNGIRMPIFRNNIILNRM